MAYNRPATRGLIPFLSKPSQKKNKKHWKILQSRFQSRLTFAYRAGMKQQRSISVPDSNNPPGTTISLQITVEPAAITTLLRIAPCWPYTSENETNTGQFRTISEINKLLRITLLSIIACPYAAISALDDDSYNGSPQAGRLNLIISNLRALNSTSALNLFLLSRLD